MYTSHNSIQRFKKEYLEERFSCETDLNKKIAYIHQILKIRMTIDQILCNKTRQGKMY